MVNLFVSGDIVNTSNISGSIIAEDLEKVIKSCDYAVCNFEAPIEGFGAPILKSGSHIKNKKKTIKALKSHGFHLLLLANNHMMDYGAEAMQATKDLALSENLDVVGAGSDFDEAYRPLIKEINGLRFGIINACEAQFGVLDYYQSKTSAGYSWINHNQIDKNILQLKKECDFVLVFSHAGLENYNIPQKEWRERYKHLCDLGADVIVGCHPHVPQGYEQYRQSLIFYSLGNFYFDWGRWENSLDSSYGIKLSFEKKKPPQVEPIFHITDIQYKRVRLASNYERINLDYLNSLLESNYEKLHEEMTLDIYKKHVRPNLIRGLLSFPEGGALRLFLKEIVATLLGRRKNLNRSILSLHFIRNEAYYFSARNSLEFFAKKTKSK